MHWASAKTNIINKTPWAIPTNLTAKGISKMYFIGIAIKSSIKYDIPSI